MKSWSARLLLAGLLAAIAAGASGARPPGEPPSFKPEEIEALVAPIALYPDSLLSQVLMAATYPLEVVHAARWLKANPNLKGEAAVKAVAGHTWDASVKSLVAFPQVLEPMNEKLDWTQKLGDAFLAQQKDVLDAVQRLRQRAEQSGNLRSTEQQQVTVEQVPPQQTVIKIEPANPEVVYVPVYDPAVVYGAWPYPGYPPYYWPPPPYYYAGGALVAGFAIAAAFAIYGNCDWGDGEVAVDPHKAASIDKNFDRTKVSGNRWQHDASHRRGVPYRDAASREKFGQDVPGADARSDFRGREGGPGDRAGAGPGPGDRGGAGRDHAFQGVGGGAASQRDLDRGRASNLSMAGSRGGVGGGARPMGGGGRGGRR